MALENEINQKKFRSEYQKARINLVYTYNWMMESVNAIFDQWDITPRQFNILRILRGEGKALSTLQIRKRMLDKMSDTSRIVERLLKKGLVKKTPNTEDRRLVDVVITSKGKKLLEKIDPLEDKMDKLMASLTEEEAKTFNNLMDKLRSTLAIVWFACLLALHPGRCFSQADSSSGMTSPTPVMPILPAPERPKYEFRAAWIASVENIDWPSQKGLPPDSQRVEFIRQLDMHQKNGLNAVVVQIRPAADAFYPSPYEPWSEWLTGVQGRPPAPYYDPLLFMIEETHKRGMEFHAWCNPYRAVKTIGKSSVASDHISRVHPEWFVRFENTLYFDPGNKEVQEYVTMVIRDIVRRYDIDALHFDDYFYPYDIVEGSPKSDFPDKASYEKYGNGLSIGDWRRSNVDSVILKLSEAIKEEKKYCKFGISPFAIWRNKSKDPEGSDTQGGVTDYDNLYANILLWLKKGWIDYVVPQIYFEFTQPHAPYGPLLDWWARNCYGKQCYIGLAIYKAGANAAWRDPSQLTRQIQALRGYPTVQGAVYFSSKSFVNNPYGWCDSLQNHYYNYPALVPPMPWLDSTRPHDPAFRVEYNKKDLTSTIWMTKGATNDSLRGYVLYRTDSATLDPHSTPALNFIPYDPVAVFTIHNSPAETKGKVWYYFATALSQRNVESEPVPVILANF